MVESEGVGPESVGAEALGNLQKYMDEMDQELMDTNIGQSFTQNVSTASMFCFHSQTFKWSIII